MLKKTKTSISLLLAALLSACSEEKLPEFNRLDSMRTLALVASTPETSVGSSVTITPVVSDANGNGRTLTYKSEGCLDPGIGYGAYPDCTGAQSFQTLSSGTVTTLASPNYSGAANTITFTIPSDVFNGKTSIEQYNGVPYIFLYTLTASDGSEVRSFKRIIVSIKSAKNANPTFSKILANDQPFTALPINVPLKLKPSYSDSSAESYTTLTDAGVVGTKTETLTTSWFVSEGSLEFYRTTDQTENTFSVSFLPNRLVVFIAVLRDDRGGEAFIKLEL